MAKPVLLQDDFSGGMKPDYPVEKLPKNSVLLMQNYIPSHEGGVAARDGWHRVGETLGDTYAAALAFAPFSAGVQLVGITDQGAVKQVPKVDSGTNTARGTAQVPAQSPVFYRNNLYITNSDGTTSLKVYGGSGNASAATGSPPAAMYACVYKDHLVLARTAANPNRVWFSSGGDAASWDTAADGQWLDCSFPITGIVTLRNMILVFGEEGIERIRGDIIPGVAGSDMVREPLFAAGCADATSIAVSDEYCVFANATGIFMTDGITMVDLAQQGGIRGYWRKTTWPYSSGISLAGGLMEGKYIITAHSSSTLVRTLVCDIRTRTWYEFTNIPAIMYATSPSGLAGVTAGDLFFAERDASWLVNAGSIFRPRSTQDDLFTWTGYDDNNATDTTLALRTGFFNGGVAGRKRIHDVYVTAHHSSPMAATVYAYPDSQMDHDDRVSLGTLTASTDSIQRKAFPYSRRGYGIGVEISTAATTAGFGPRIDKIEADMRSLESSV
jgi:hypothetical protein